MANEPVNPNTNPNSEPNKDAPKATETKGADTTALEAKIKQLESENSKLKQAQTNASADASAWKKKYQDTLSEQDKAKAEQEESTAAMKARLAQLESEANIAKFTAALSASDIGMDAENAKAVAEALNTGNTDDVFAGIRKFIASHDKALAEKAMLNNPKLPGGSSTKTVTKEQFDAMGYREMVQFKAEHPDLYNEYMNKS